MAHFVSDHIAGADFLAAAHQKISAFGQGILNGIEANARARSGFNRITRLNAKSDAELAQMGLTRDGIARHVFKDIFFD